MSKISALVLGFVLALPLGAGTAAAEGYAALAAGSGNLNSGRSYTVTGVGYAATLEEAEQLAMKDCRGKQKFKACEVVVTHNYGCAFVARGAASTYTGWAFGLTPAEALKKIEDAGLVSSGFPKGGCFIDGEYIQ